MSTLNKLVFPMCATAIFCGGVIARDLPIKMTGYTVSPDGVPYYSVETRGYDSNGKETGMDWRLVREVTDSTGKTVQEAVLRAGEKQVDGSKIIDAFWSVNSGRISLRWVPATYDHAAYMETQTAIVMVCSGWTSGEFRGICQFLPDSGEVKVLLRAGDEALYAVPGGNSAVAHQLSGEFRSPVLSEKDDTIGYGGVMLVFPDCNDGSGVVTRCLIATGLGQEKPHVVFLDGTDEWKIKFVGVTEPDGEEMTVEEIPKVIGWSAYFKVEKEGVVRPAMATVLPNGETVVRITESPWVE